MRRGVVFGMAFVVALVLAPAAKASQQVSEVRRLTANLDTGQIVDGAAASLSRGTFGLSMRLSTRNLRPGHAYTVWWITFDRPENCLSNPLGAMRCSLVDGFSPLTAASHTWADGDIAAADGTATFTDRLRVGDPPEFRELGEGGLADPSGAEVVVILRDHGPAVEGSDQTTTMNGGCIPMPFDPPIGHGSPGTYPCENAQLASFPSP